MKKYYVEVTITKSYKLSVVVEGEFDGISDKKLEIEAASVAEKMEHENFVYESTECEIHNLIELSSELSSDHISLLQAGYPLKWVENYSEADSDAEHQDQEGPVQPRRLLESQVRRAGGQDRGRDGQGQA